MKMPKVGSKSALFACFWAIILKNQCPIYNQDPRIDVITKFCKERKLPEFGTKNVLLEYF